MSTVPTRAYRFGMWVVVALGLPGLFAAFLGARGVIPLPLGIAGAFAFIVCVLLGALVGLQARRQMQLQREKENYSTMLVILATQLRVQDDVVLQGIAGKGGPAGEAAELVLQGRRETGDRRRESGERRSVHGISTPDSPELADEISD
ncbi:MAG TPA: hypothetical protein VLB12_09625 [Gemmatimonadales bacterium]|nr:hypothetical protein [Gemmatimonadales bacterium]